MDISAPTQASCSDIELVTIVNHERPKIEIVWKSQPSISTSTAATAAKTTQDQEILPPTSPIYDVSDDSAGPNHQSTTQQARIRQSNKQDSATNAPNNEPVLVYSMVKTHVSGELSENAQQTLMFFSLIFEVCGVS